MTDIYSITGTVRGVELPIAIYDTREEAERWRDWLMEHRERHTYEIIRLYADALNPDLEAIADARDATKAAAKAKKS